MPYGPPLGRGEGGPPTPAPLPKHHGVSFSLAHSLPRDPFFFSIKPEDRAPAESSDHGLAARTRGPPITRTTAV